MSDKPDPADEILKRSLETLFDETPDPVFVMDTTGRLVAGNPALVERGGLDADALAAQPVLPAVHPDDRDRVEAEFQAALAGETRRYTSRVLLPDGETFVAEVVNAPIVSAGEVVGVLGIAHDVDEVAGIRTSLDRTEGLLRIASRMARLGGWSVDLRTGSRLWSEGMYEILGLEGGSTPHEEDLLTRVEPHQRGMLADALALCEAEGTPVDFSGSFLRPDGVVIDARVVGEAVRDGNGVIVGIHGALSDTTDELRALRERKDLETRLADAFDGIDDAIAFVDPDWKLTFLNARAVALLGHGKTDLVGTELWDLQIPDPEGAAMLREAMSSRRLLVRRRYDLELGRWMETTGFPAGDLLGIQVRDVTEMEDARRRILDDTKLIHAQTSLLDEARDGIIMRGLDDIIEYANAAASAMLGIPGQDLVGRPLSTVLGFDEETTRAGEASIGTSKRWDREFVVANPDGDRIIDSRWQVVAAPDGNPEAVFCVMTDVTEQRQQQEVALRNQRMESIGTLAGGIAHDLNNVLTPLLLSTQLLGEGETDPARARIYAGMQTTIDRGAAMIRQVLTFARGVEGEREIVDLTDLVGRFGDFCRDILPKTIELDFSAAKGLHVLGDPTQLMQVLMNLATNARDAMPTGGRLTVRADGDAATVAVEISDVGTGIRPETLARIFEPFFTTKGVGTGTGLGLSVSQAIARTHGGTLEATSVVGSGTTFRLELPSIEPSVEPVAPGSVRERVRLSGLRVLIVDDENVIVDAASLVVAGAGGIPFGATGASEGGDVLAAQEIDVILTDLVMPGTSGQEFIDWLAIAHPTIPIVAMSGVPEQAVLAAKRPNVRGTLDKPFTSTQLVRALGHASPQNAD